MKQWLPKAELTDVGRPTMRMRMVKSPEEIQLTKDGAEIAELGAKVAVEAIKEGVSEYEVALASTERMVREIAARYPHSGLQDSKFTKSR